MAFNPHEPHSVQQYVAGALSEQDRDRFEEQLLGDSELQRLVFAEQEFKAGLNDIASELIAAHSPSFWQRVREYIITPAWSYTATAALLLVLAWNFSSVGQTQHTTQEALVIDKVLIVDTLRSSFGEQHADIISAQSSVLVSMPAPTGDGHLAEFILRKADKVIVKKSGLVVSDERDVNIKLPPLEPGVYTMTLTKPGYSLEHSLTVTP
jgi:hypothetical protein